ncbi:hypothetical protein SAMN04487957_11058 [Halomonas shengliensis]|uniref:Uncharacterized protein n=1 Tax=Halomonas shengliensis TaxID=419597 RepID=A0A1H0LQQ8_9GAMM|nr:hypothetical protein [Halomonas shengliensis]SDO70361.1 hypothetical protein SAMN04487957_11058 [Halomonas shengliensis]
MSKGGEVVADAVREMLLGLADALDDAQSTLSETARTSDTGHGYEIPYLDFTFEVEFSEEQSQGDRPPRIALLPKARRAGGEGERETRISSSISGRLATVPVQGGRPETLLDLTLKPVDGRPRQWRLGVAVSNLAGERLPGVPVSLQVDAAMTEQLLGHRPSAEQRLGLLTTQRLTTGVEGGAELVIDTASLRGRRVVVQVEARGAIGRVILPGEAA